MSWLNGQLLRAPELKAHNGLDVGTSYAFGQPVKLWIDVDTPRGTHWTSIPAVPVGVFIGAQGRVHYKLALEIGDTGIYSVVEAPSALITRVDVEKYDGPNWEVDAKELTSFLGKRQVELITRPVDGFLKKEKTTDRHHYSIFNKYSVAVGDIVHECVNMSLPKLHEQLGFDSVDVSVDEIDTGILLDVHGRQVKFIFHPAGANWQSCRMAFLRPHHNFPVFTDFYPNASFDGVKQMLAYFLSNGTIRRQPDAVTQLFPTASVEVKGIHIKRDFLSKLDEVNNVMGGLLHRIALVVAQTVIQHTGKFDDTFKLIVVDRHTYCLVYRNRKVTVHGVRAKHEHSPFTVSFNWTDAPRPGQNWNIPDQQHEDVFVKKASDFLLSIPNNMQ